MRETAAVLYFSLWQWEKTLEELLKITSEWVKGGWLSNSRKVFSNYRDSGERGKPTREKQFRGS